MGSRKGLCIAGGVVTLVSTFVFSWRFGIETLSGWSILNIANLFSPVSVYNIIALILFICVLVSGALIIVGIKSGAGGLAIAFGIIDVVFASLIIVLWIIPISIPVLDDIMMDSLYYMISHSYSIFGILPLNYDIFLTGVGIGTYLLLIGGILGIVGGASSEV
ncbi:MAG: hypothetical protein GF329_09070 [Candidatus Lokiarchaeota archaeon]|nr:hypothetical protein [Candidatus Lokiarchaeota archaeon]